ncbi:MAG: DUF1292 domain-containing protein [Lachnospiraceae bacterium]|jgi:hypothetical protein|nr:DUF1292 domain-containing protein [Lachnospiraceae bacterium]
MEKVVFTPDDGQEPIEFYPVEQTKFNGVSYLLVTDVPTGDGECLILRDDSDENDTESLYRIVEDKNELKALLGIFEEMLEDVVIMEDQT